MLTVLIRRSYLRRLIVTLVWVHLIPMFSVDCTQKVFSGWQSELIIEVKKKESNLNITKISKQISTAMKLEVASKSFLWLSQFACPRLRTVFKHIQQFYTTEWWLLLIAFITRILVHCHRLRQNDDIICKIKKRKLTKPKVEIFHINVFPVDVVSFEKPVWLSRWV